LGQKRLEVALHFLLILVVAYFTFMKNYQYPDAQFWDENYHIASAQKYVDGVMYMEPHPPLGKMFIALGEHLINPNANINRDEFLKTDYIKTFPNGYSFKGVRFFPTLFAMLGAGLFFLLLYQISKNSLISLLFSSLYLFDNALIIHSRSAMLESSQIFFILLSLVYLFYLINKPTIAKWFHYLIFGFSVGFIIAIKANGAIFILLFIFLAYFDIYKNLSFKSLLFYRELIIKGVMFSLGVAFIFFATFYIHFSLGKEIKDNRNYSASSEYLEIIKNGATSNLLNFPIMMRDNFAYMKKYQEGVPQLDICKVGENGSYPAGWTLGIKSINYRWAKNSDEVRYLYLQGNPIVWFGSLIGVILAFILIGAKFVFGLEIKEKREFNYMIIFMTLYLAYMIAVMQIPRVMYLYHYFIPLILSMVILFLVFNYIFKELLEDKVLLGGLIFAVLLIIYVYNFFAPLTYYEPLTQSEFIKRVWFDFWMLKPIL